MKRLIPVLLAMMLAVMAYPTVMAEELPDLTLTGSDELLGELAPLLERMEGSEYLKYSQLNNAMGNNRLVYDDQYLYFCWGNALYCAEYNGEDFWELTDTLRDNTSLALSGEKVYFNSAVGGTSYFTSMKKDGSEMPVKIISFKSFEQKLHATYGYYNAFIYSFVTPWDDDAKICCYYWAQERNQVDWNDDYWGEFKGIAYYNIDDNTFEKGPYWSRTYREEKPNEKYFTMSASWIQKDFMVYDSAARDGIRYKDRVTDDTNVISVMNPISLIARDGKVYFIERDTNKLYRMSNVGSQKRKLLENVKCFLITEKGLMLYVTEEGLFAADQDGKNETMVTDRIKGRFYLMGDWVYWFTDTALNRLNCHTGETEIVFDPAWV